MPVLRGWIQIVGVMLLLLILLLATATYTVTTIINQSGITWPVVFGMLATLTAVNIWLLLLVWQRRATLGPYVHIATILWGGVAIWYWTFAPLYYALNMHLNAQQLAWVAFSFLWEVPVIGGGVLTTCGVLLFRAIGRAPTHRAYSQALKYPGRIAILIFCLSCIGYIIGAQQLWQFAAVSWFELVKSMLNGPVVSIFPAIFYYLTLDNYLDQLRRRLSQNLPHSSWPVRHIRRRLTTVSIVVLLGAVGLLGLLVVESFQRLSEQQLQAALQQDIIRLQEAVEKNELADLQSFARGGHGYVLVVDAGDSMDLPVSNETKSIVSEGVEGVIRDLAAPGKMLGFFTTESGQKVISVVYLTAIYDFLRWPEFATYGLGSLLVIVLTTGIFMFVVYEITRALTSLRLLAQDPKPSHWNELVGVHTGDEIEAVGRSFMRYVQKAKEVDKVKQEFVSLASHQLRTPLTAIRWYVEILANEKDGPLNPTQQEHLDRIGRGSLRMIRLVNNLLNVSRIDSGRLAIKPEAVDVVQFMHQLIEEILPPNEQIQCKIMVEEHLTNPTLWVDRLLLRQVIHNLLTNALKYKSPDRPCQVTIVLQRDVHRQLVITVKDSGIGIPADQQHRIFDRFFRADNAAMVDTEGTGLGLYVSKMLLDAAGCNITCVSREGVGTEFKITIPKNGMLAKPGEIGLSFKDD